MSIDISKGAYFTCNIESCGKRFLATTNEHLKHILDDHGKELWLRGPNVCKKYLELNMSFFKQTN